jgi:putative pyruvate formate lyase activating enzyme
MSQYTPVYRAGEFHEIDRRLSTFEYRTVAEVLEQSGFDGYVQQKTSASEEFIPKFYGEKYY